MVARLVLPSYGGSATVWSTTSLFFQVLLLLGYLYTHLTTCRLGPRCLALVSYAAHARLAAERPPARELTAYYLVISTGGALGGLLNGLIAPMVFNQVWEYAIVALLVPVVLIEQSVRPLDD